MNQQPEIEVRRQMLTQMRDNLRAQGFEAETNASVLLVQSVPLEQKEQQEDAMRDLNAKAQNCYRGAEELSSQLSKLPKPKKEKKA